MVSNVKTGWLMIVILLLAFAVRVWQLQDMPPGWRDDELINSLVISQKALDGDLTVYYADASGHEALYHVLNAGMLVLFGANAVGIRLLSAFLGLITVAFTYRVGKQIGGPTAGLLASAALALSFWSLMYSRIGLRHVLTPPLMLGAVFFFLRGWWAVGSIQYSVFSIRYSVFSRQSPISQSPNRPITNYQLPITKLPITNYLLSAIFISLGIYTYFASRGVPLIFLAVVGYGALFMWPQFKKQWLGIVVMFVLTAVFALPLIFTLQNQPESEARVAELAVPLVEAEAGNYEPLRQHVVITLSMFHADGDDEWLYNIPNRPVFVGVTAVLFWLGVLIAIWDAIQPLLWRIRKRPLTNTQAQRSFNSALLFAWWLAGISPGFISVPPASLGHTIMAQPAVFILLALPIARVFSIQYSVFSKQSPISQLQNYPITKLPNYQLPITTILLLTLTALIAFRDLPDYFTDWPERGLVRFLYRADIRDVADYVNEEELTDFGVTGLLAGPWDKLALEIDLDHDARPRWYDPQRAILLSPSTSFSGFPDVPVAFADGFGDLATAPRAGYYAFTETSYEFEPLPEPVCFENGLCAISATFDSETNRLFLGWEAERPLTLPPNPLISNPPPPGVYSGPRLAVFGQLLGENDIFLTGDDGLWVDPYTLHEGDIFVQQHWLLPPEEAQIKFALFGLYDPMTGQRILTTDGADHVRLNLEEIRP